VFKLIGPALIKQDLVEAKSNVSKRIEYIKGELDRADNQIKSLKSKSEEKEGEVGGCCFMARAEAVCFPKQNSRPKYSTS
jgi:prefoldin beta subunit